MEYQLFMCALDAQWLDMLEKELTLYKGKIGNYVIAHEISTDGTHEETKGSHFHFLVQMNKDSYHNYCKRVFIDKFKLRGRAVAGKPRQYGKMKGIRDLEKAKSYVVKDMTKDKKSIRTNMSDELIDEAFSKSFKKVEPVKKLYDELMNHLKEFSKENKMSSYDIQLEIIGYYRINKTKKRLSRPILNGLCCDYMMYYDSRYTAMDIYNYLY